ncbi:MAG: phosphatase PAP2 family protein [Nitratireductor sp.]
MNDETKPETRIATASVVARTKKATAAMPAKMQGWWGGIQQWFAFVHHRRNDVRFPVFPSLLTLAEALAVLASAIVFLSFFVDPVVLEKLRHPGFEADPVFKFITRFGESAWVLYVTGIGLVGATVLTANRFRGKGRFLWHRLVLNAYYIFTTVAFSGLLANLLKNLIGRARPKFTEVGHVWQSIPFHDSYKFASFPSGHATTAGALAMGLALLFPRARVFFLLAGVWVAISRPALGVHFPSDVLAGFAFGAAFSWFYARAFARTRLLFEFDGRWGLKLRGAPGFARLWARKS